MTTKKKRRRKRTATIPDLAQSRGGVNARIRPVRELQQRTSLISTFLLLLSFFLLPNFIAGCSGLQISAAISPRPISTPLTSPPSVSPISPPLASPPSHKEKPYALIFGTVWGPDNRPVAGVEVKIRPADKERSKWEVYSNRIGEFEQRVPAGKADYVLEADYKPPKDSKYHQDNNIKLHAETTVHVENDERVDTGLHLK